MKTYKNWTLIDWDGNRSLKLKCWRKSFGHGHVSVGIGTFYDIVYSFGADSDDSFSSTRNNGGIILSEREAMEEAERKVLRMLA